MIKLDNLLKSRNILFGLKALLVFFIVTVVLFSLFHPAFAQYKNQEKIPGAEPTSDFVQYMKDIINFLLATAGIMALFMLIIGAYMYLMSAGNVGSADQAKQTIGSALLGLLLAMCAWVILYKINPDLVSLRGISQISGSIPGNLSITGIIGNYATIKPSGDRATATLAYIDTIKKYANQNKIPVEIAFGLIAQESSGNPNSVSPKGATGLGQIMPENFASLGITDPKDSEQSIRGSMIYLRQMYDQFGTWDAAVAAYNCGPNKLEKASTWGNLPAETRNHVPAVMGYANWYKQQNGQQQSTRIM